MKPRLGNQRNTALTLTEALLVIAVLALLTAILLPALAARKQKSNRVGCVNNLKQIGISYRMWTDDHDGKFPMQISVTNDGVMELAITGNVAAIFCILPNSLSDPAILICPNDACRFPATSFATLQNSNISYFISLATIDTQPQTLLSGDDNLVVNGQKVQSGILNLHANDVLAWTKERHNGAGNLLLGDGSVQQATSAELTSTARLATNRLAIP